MGILAGMGPAAGVDFARLFLQACETCLRAHAQPIRDQAFPEHWLAQVPVVDRTTALADASAAQPLDAMSRALGQLIGLGARAVAISCNTAHAWHGRLQAIHAGVQLLHIADETVAELRRQGHAQAVLLATQGTYRMGLYDQAFEVHGVACILPSETERVWLMEGIYQGVKAGDVALAQRRFVEVGAALRARHGDVPLVMACTEIPLALPFAPEAAGWTLVDPSAILAMALARKAYGLD
ncbi:MAG: Aspartate racemase [Paracidovorax wautersii]|uniref:Aspartate racemase n=1 Tax=Paracidovorax wautersii TaxID=1177982 RepID=A0A7V8FPN1_9BURK|nr:MAG: Aspartate racemase [Paracidovorax wautersii]